MYVIAIGVLDLAFSIFMIHRLFLYRTGQPTRRALVKAKRKEIAALPVTELERRVGLRLPQTILREYEAATDPADISRLVVELARSYEAATGRKILTQKTSPVDPDPAAFLNDEDREWLATYATPWYDKDTREKGTP